MRLLDLAFERYGPFDGLRLSFDPEAKVHIVYGANEAGKSSALAALGDLFYGAPRGAYSFLRPRDMRLAAALRGRNGQILQFSRRRGARNTLLDSAGAPLPDDALAPFLGGATRDMFQRAFGLDAASLREGGEDMLRAEGEIGASLFAAASGLRGLLELKAGLEAEAEGIFDDRRASHRAFYQALDRFDAARAQEKTSSVSEGALKALAEAIAAADRELEEIERLEKGEQAEALRLGRLRKAAPILRKLAQLREEAAAYDDLAGVGPEAAAKLAVAVAARAEARLASDAARKACEAARRERDASAPDPAVLAEAEAIDDLVRASGAYEKSAADLPRREKAFRDMRQALLGHAATLGLAQVDDLRAALPDAALLVRTEKLATKGQELLARKDQRARDLAAEESRLADFAAAPQANGPDTETLREKLRAFGEIEALDATCRGLSSACADRARALDEQCGRLSPPLPDLAAFARSPSPDAAAIEKCAQAFDDCAAREAAAREDVRKAGEELAAARARLRVLERQGAAPSHADLRALRDRRDAQWRELTRLFEGDALLEPAGLRDKARLFEAFAGEADRSADALLANAAQAAGAEAERERIAAAQSALDDSEAALAALAADGALLREDWVALWRDCGISPANPRAMRLWRDLADRLLNDRDALLREQARAAELSAALERIVTGLDALTVECGLSPLPLDAAASARRLVTKIDAIAREQSAAREAAARLADAPQRIAKLKGELAALAEAESLWRADWRAALVALRLDPDARFEEAQARIGLWRDLPRDLQEEQDRAARVDSIRADIAGFEQRLDERLALCARDIAARPAMEAVAQLRRRLSQAREQAALRKRAEAALAEAEAAAQQAALALAEAEAEASALCARLGMAGDAGALAERLAAREAAAREIRDERARLDLVADGHDEAELAAELAGFDADQAVIRLGQIERRSEARKARAHEAFAERRARQAELARLQESAGAEAAILARECARAEIAEQSRRWAVLKLAGLLVGAGLERRRSQQQDPLLAEAGALFRALTGERYDGLGQTFGEDDEIHLTARRADGEALELAALSEGTRDQLYLALRLGFLTDYAARSEAPPFIGDDLFASFDDSRAAAGFQALSVAAATIQPILFTHHAHIVEIARQALGAQAQILHLEATTP
jgi:uncharacterized protein YhaN